jgi:hypothetical protein
VKDGGDNPNKRNMPEYRGKQQAKEIMITELGKFNYLRLTNNDFSQLLEALAEIKYENMDQSTAPKVNFFINESMIKEEVGGLPPRRASSTWIEPYFMDNHFDLSINNDNSDKVIIKDNDGNIKAVLRKDLENEGYTPSGEMLVYNGSNSDSIFKDLLHSQTTFSEALYKVAGYRFRSLDELALIPNWKYHNKTIEAVSNDMITRGIYRENQIISGQLKTFDVNDAPLKGAVFVGRSNQGYYIHTPKDYYLSSDFYESIEDIPQNMIDLMADLYDQYKKRVMPNE